MLLIQFMPLTVFSLTITLDIKYASKQRQCVH